MKTKLLFLLVLVMGLIIPSCVKKDETPTTKKTSMDCINENGPAFFCNSQGQCEWAPALTVMNTGTVWYTQTIHAAAPYDAYLVLHREKGETIGWGKIYSRVAGYGGWTEGTGNLWSSGAFQWTLAPGNDKAFLISMQGNCTITQISAISSNAAAYPTSFTCTIVSAAGSRSQTFTLQSGVGPFGNN